MFTLSDHTTAKSLTIAVLGASFAFHISIASAEMGAEPDATVGASPRDTVTTTALRREQTLLEAPAAVNAFTETEIERSNITRPDDFVNRIPNAALINSNVEGEAFLVLRGMAPARNAETSTATIVDGVLATGPNELNQDFFDLQQIEVLKGPQSALYGRNAVGGAVIITTKAPTNDFEGKIKVGSGEQGRVLAQGSISGPIIEDRLFGRLAVQHHQRGGKLENIFTGEERDRFRRQSARARLDWNVNENLTVDIRGAVSRVRDTGGINFVAQIAGVNVGDTLDINEDFPDFQNNIPSFNEQDKESGSLKIDWDTEHGTLTSITAFSSTEDRYGQDNFPYFFGDDGPRDEGFTGQTQWVLFNYSTISQDLRWTSPGDRRFRYIVGAYFAYIENDRITNLADDIGGILLDGRFPIEDPLNPTFAYRNDETERTNYAFYAHLAYDILENLEVTAALRYDHEKAEVTNLAPIEWHTSPDTFLEDTYDKLQPKFTINYTPTENISVFAAYGEGFKAGGFNPFGTEVAVLDINPNSTVKDAYSEESTRTVEAGFKGRFLDGSLEVNAGAFYTWANNMQVFEFFPAASLQANAQVDKAKVRGFEIDFLWQVTDQLRFSGGYGYTKSTVSELASDPMLVGNFLPYTPRHTINLSGEYVQPISNSMEVIFRIDWKQIGKTWWNLPNTPGTRREAIDLVDLTVTLDGGDWQLQAWVKNLTDKTYFADPVVLLEGLAASYYGPPRYWGADFTYRF